MCVLSSIICPDDILQVCECVYMPLCSQGSAEISTVAGLDMQQLWRPDVNRVHHHEDKPASALVRRCITVSTQGQLNEGFSFAISVARVH